MKKKYLSILFLFFVFTIDSFSTANAQLFQNNNTNCEAKEVLCASNGGSCRPSDVVSIACKNIFQSADFNGDRFADCAAVTDSSNPGANGYGPRQVSVLISQGAGTCGVGTGQFKDSLDYNFFFTLELGGDIGSMVVGDIHNTHLTETAFTMVDPKNGFGAPLSPQLLISPDPNPNTIFGTNFSSIAPNVQHVDYIPSGGARVTGYPSSQGDRNLALLDCNGDNLLDAVTVGSVGNSTYRFNILTNKLGNLTASSSIDTAISQTTGGAAVVAVGDFNGDHLSDVAVVINESVASKSRALIYLSEGDCHFTTPSTDIHLDNSNNDIDRHIVGSNPRPFSATTGDFNGDGNLDLVISEPKLSTLKGIHYFFGDGKGHFSSNQHIAYNPNTGLAPFVLTTGCFNNDNVQDIAVSYSYLPEASPNTFNEAHPVGSVEIFSSVEAANIPATINPTPTTLSFSGSVFSVNGIDSANFDNQGGDDIIALGTEREKRQAYVFMHTIDTIIATIDTPDQTISQGTPIQLSGKCAIANDPNAQFTQQWSITSPNAADGVLTNETTLTPTFTPKKEGIFTFKLTCNTACGSATASSSTNANSKDKDFQVTSTSPFTDQGGCVRSSLSPMSSPVNMSSLLTLLGPAGLLLIKRRKNRETKR